MIPQTLPHKFRLMASAFDGTLNQSVSETHEAESEGSDMDSYYVGNDKTTPKVWAKILSPFAVIFPSNVFAQTLGVVLSFPTINIQYYTRCTPNSSFCFSLAAFMSPF